MGRMTEQEACDLGFTHAGRIGPIPVWMEVSDADCPAVCAQHDWLDPALDVWLALARLWQMATRGDPDKVWLRVGRQIARPRMGGEIGPRWRA